MDSHLQSFKTLDEISNSTKKINKKQSVARLTPSDQIIISDIIGGRKVSDIDKEKVIDDWEDRRGDCLTDLQKNRGERFIDDLILDEEGTKDNIFWLPESLKYECLSIVQKELPPEVYPISQLIHAVRSGILGAKEHMKTYINWLEDENCEPHIAIRDMVAGLVQERDRKIYAVPTVPFKAHVVVAGKATECEEAGIESYSILLKRELCESIKNADHRELASLCRRKMYVAAAFLCGFNSFTRKYYQNFESQLVNALLHPSSKRALFGIAKPLVIDGMTCGGDNLKAFFAKQITKVRNAIGDNQ